MWYGGGQCKLDDPHGSWHFNICRSLFGLSTYLCFTRVCEGNLYVVLLGPRCLIRTICKYSMLLPYYGYHIYLRPIFLQRKPQLYFEKERRDFSVDSCRSPEKVLARFAERVYPVSNLTFVCCFGAFSDSLSTILENYFSTHLLIITENHKLDCWQSVFLSKFSWGYEASTLYLKREWDETWARHAREEGFFLVSPSSLLGHTALVPPSSLLGHIPPFCVRDD